MKNYGVSVPPEFPPVSHITVLVLLELAKGKQIKAVRRLIRMCIESGQEGFLETFWRYGIYLVTPNNVYSVTPNIVYSVTPNNVYSVTPNIIYSVTPNNVYSVI
jgi:hypothetical protein